MPTISPAPFRLSKPSARTAPITAPRPCQVGSQGGECPLLLSPAATGGHPGRGRSGGTSTVTNPTYIHGASHFKFRRASRPRSNFDPRREPDRLSR